jgi:hypothetical protein
MAVADFVVVFIEFQPMSRGGGFLDVQFISLLGQAVTRPMPALFGLEPYEQVNITTGGN